MGRYGGEVRALEPRDDFWDFPPNLPHDSKERLEIGENVSIACV